MKQISYDILTNALNILEKSAQPERQIKCHDRRRLLCHTCLGCSTEWWVPREDLPKSPPLRSSSGLQLRVRAPGSSSSPTTGKRTGPTVNSGRYLSAKKSEEKFEGLSLQNWIEKGKLKNRKHSNMFLLRCKAGIMVFGILRA